MNWPETSLGGVLGDGRHAHATDRPESIEGLCEGVSARVREGHAIYPQGGGTVLDFGGVPRSPGVAIDTRGLGRVIDYPAADMTITVEAGITLKTLQDVLAKENQRLLIDAPDPARATLGGIYATNASGPRRFGAGRPRDQIIGVSFVTSEGVVVKGGGRVVKNVAGYDLPRLLTGSMGTLGVIAQMTLKVRPRPEATAIVWMPLNSLEKTGLAMEALNTSGTRPMAVEVLNREGARVVAGPGGLAVDDWVLAVGLEDNAASVTWQLERLRTELAGTVSEVREGVDAGPLWRALTEFQAMELGTVCVVASLRPSELGGFMKELKQGDWAMQSHAGNGVVRAHALGEWKLEELGAEVDRLRGLAVRGGGNLTLSRCPTEWKERLRVWGEPRGDWRLAEGIKKALDPRGVMNPGRFIGII